jgi:enoyl-CoA hydratase/carnithine racemase
MPTEDTALLLTEQLGSIRLLSINRPDKHNAFTPTTLHLLDEAIDAAAADDDTRVLIVTGSGSKAFVAGNDIKGLLTLDGVAAYRQMMAGQRVFRKLYDLPKPTIAMVNGYALGGGFELALSCDFILASDNARFGFPEITLNTMPGWGGTQLAVKKMGLARAKQMVLSGRHYTADECRHFGFIHQITPAADLRAEALAFAGQFAGHNSFAMEMAKRSVNHAAELPLGVGLDLEAANYAVNFATAGARDGLKAFAARRAEARPNGRTAPRTTG